MRTLFQIFYNEETNRLGRNPVSTCPRWFCTSPLQKDLLKRGKKAQFRNEFLRTAEEDGDIRSDDVNRHLSLIWKKPIKEILYDGLVLICCQNLCFYRLWVVCSDITLFITVCYVSQKREWITNRQKEGFWHLNKFDRCHWLFGGGVSWCCGATDFWW